MSELNELNNNKYAYLRNLSMEELLELLAVAPIPAVSPEKHAYVDALKEAIIEKEDEEPTGFFPDVDQQWEQFVNQYLPDAEEAALEPDHIEHADLPNRQFPEVPPKRVVRFGRVWRTALIAAAAVACMLAAMVTAQAAGVDVFGAMARWSEDIFSFGQIPPDSEVSDNPAKETVGQEIQAPGSEFTSLQEAFDAYGMTEVHEPSWLPEGYALDSIDVLAMDDPFLRTFSVAYTNGEKRVSIDITSYEGEPTTQVQKLEGPVEPVKKNDVMFYCIGNSVGRTIAWYSDLFEYYLCGDVEEDILWEIADSMFE